MKNYVEDRIAIALYERAMTALVRLAHFNVIDNSRFKNEIDEFSEGLLHGDVLDLALSARQLIELCEIESASKQIIIKCVPNATNFYKISSRIIHSKSLRIITDRMNFELHFTNLSANDAALEFMEKYHSVTFEERRMNPLVVCKTKQDGCTIFRLADLVKTADEVIKIAVIACSEDKIYLERCIRDPARL